MTSLPAAGPLAAPLSIPSPPWSDFHIGPLTIHYYALCILTGIIVAWIMTKRRFIARGGNGEQFENIAAVSIVLGIIGARLYHITSDYELYFVPGKDPIRALYIWDGGLGIWGAVALGGLGVWLMARHYGIPFGDIADSFAPGLLVAQAIGRIGNWFNQELFGRPTTLPWGLQIAPQYRPAGFTQYSTFHPTFLYELIWDLFSAFVLLRLERRFRLGRGRTFTAYVALYTFGRFWVESLRIDHANKPFGFRLNDYTSVIVFVGAIIVWVILARKRPGLLDHPLRPRSEREQEAAPPDEPGATDGATGGTDPAESAPSVSDS